MERRTSSMERRTSSVRAMEEVLLSHSSPLHEDNVIGLLQEANAVCLEDCITANEVRWIIPLSLSLPLSLIPLSDQNRQVQIETNCIPSKLRHPARHNNNSAPPNGCFGGPF